MADGVDCSLENIEIKNNLKSSPSPPDSELNTAEAVSVRYVFCVLKF